MGDSGRKSTNLAGKNLVSAFEEQIEPYQKKIYSFMLHTCGNEYTASQLTQEVFLQVFRSLSESPDDFCLTNGIYATASEISRQYSGNSKMIS